MSEWLSVGEVAARLGVSEKTVWRRAKSGALVARKVASGRGGFVWEIALPDSENFGISDRTNHPDKSDRPTGQRAAKLVKLTNLERETDRTATDRPDAQPDTSDRTNEVELLRDALARERENATFLRGIIEQLQRDGAETRLALRRALDLAPKQLSADGSLTLSNENGGAGEPSASGATGNGFQSETARNAPQRTQSGEAGIYGPDASSGRQRGGKREETGLSYGDIADALEAMLAKESRELA